MKDFFNKLLVWLQQVLPSVTAVGGMIYTYLMAKIIKLNKEKARLELKVKYGENKSYIDKLYSTKSDDDIVNSILRPDDSEGDE